MRASIPVCICAGGWWFVQRGRPELRLAVLGLVWRMLLAGLVMGVVLYPLARFSIFISAPVGFAAYLVALYLLRAVDPEELRLARDGVLARIGRGRTA